MVQAPEVEYDGTSKHYSFVGKFVSLGFRPGSTVVEHSTWIFRARVRSLPLAPGEKESYSIGPRILQFIFSGKNAIQSIFAKNIFWLFCEKRMFWVKYLIINLTKHILEIPLMKFSKNQQICYFCYPYILSEKNLDWLWMFDRRMKHSLPSSMYYFL